MRDSLEQLRLKWLHAAALITVAKAALNAQKRKQSTIEALICQHPEITPALKPKGTLHFGKVKITTDQKRDWDSLQLRKIQSKVSRDLWPFVDVPKEVRKGTVYLEKNEPELWALIRPALSLKAKPTVITCEE